MYFTNLEYLDDLPDYAFGADNIMKNIDHNSPFESAPVFDRFALFLDERLKILNILYSNFREYIESTYFDTKRTDWKFVKRLKITFCADDSIDFAVNRGINMKLSAHFIRMMTTIHYGNILKTIVE